MEKNATITATLESLLNVLDARASVDIFREIENGQEGVRGTKIFNLLSDPEFIGKYGSHRVIGVSINALTGISILIKEAK